MNAPTQICVRCLKPNPMNVRHCSCGVEFRRWRQQHVKPVFIMDVVDHARAEAKRIISEAPFAVGGTLHAQYLRLLTAELQKVTS